MGHVTRYGTAKGSVPAALQVVLRTLVEYDTPAGKFRAKAAFVTDPASATSLDTAKRWADSYGPGKTSKPEVVTCDNANIEFLRVVDIDERGEGGRAWKVVTPQRWYVDLREDVFLDCLRGRVPMQRDSENGGLVIYGPFRWVKFGTQMRLALVDSSLYREIKASVVAKAAPAVKVSSLKVGGVYVGRNTTPMVFLGKVRVSGKARLAFCDFTGFTAGNPDDFRKVYAPGNGRTLQKDYDDVTCRSVHVRQATAILMTGHSFIEKIGQIETGSTARFNRFVDGYGFPLKPERVEWVDPPQE